MKLDVPRRGQSIQAIRSAPAHKVIRGKQYKKRWNHSISGRKRRSLYQHKSQFLESQKNSTRNRKTPDDLPQGRSLASDVRYSEKPFLGLQFTLLQNLMAGAPPDNESR